jgi:hypothetical protein
MGWVATSMRKKMQDTLEVTQLEAVINGCVSLGGGRG